MDHGHEHGDGEECEACKRGPEAMRIWEDQCMQKHGWYAHFITDESPECPFGQNMHTHGIPSTFPGAYDVQLCLPQGIPPNAAHGFFVSYVDLLKKGQRFEHGDSSAGIMKGYDVLFARAEETGRELLRMILPDKKGSFDEHKMSGGLGEQWKGAEAVLEVRAVSDDKRGTRR